MSNLPAQTPSLASQNVFILSVEIPCHSVIEIQFSLETWYLPCYQPHSLDPQREEVPITKLVLYNKQIPKMMLTLTFSLAAGLANAMQIRETIAP